jgi:hypothetical protein
MLNRIEPTVEKTLIRGGVRLKSVRTNAIVRHGVAPAWRSNARRFTVHHPGDYATLNSNQSRDSTPTWLGAEIMPVTSRGSTGVSRSGWSGPDCRRTLAHDLTNRGSPPIKNETCTVE